MRKLLDTVLEVFDGKIVLPTIVGEVNPDSPEWTTLAEYDNLKLQQNSITRSARIVEKRDGKYIRTSCGTVNGMKKVFDNMVELKIKYK